MFWMPFTNDDVDTNIENTNDVADSEEEHSDVVGPSQESLNSKTKRSRLESVISKITCCNDHSFTLNQCVIKKLKLDLKKQQK